MERKATATNFYNIKQHCFSSSVGSIGWFYKLALLDFKLVFEVKMQEREGV